MRSFIKTDLRADMRLFRYGGARRLGVGLVLYAALLFAASQMLVPAARNIVLVVYALGFGALLLRRNARDEGGSGVFWYGLLAMGLMSAPLLTGDYLLSQMSFVLVYAIAGMGLVILSGYTGQISLGHAAFMACGAYTQAVLHAKGVGILVSLPAALLLSAFLGLIIGLPALRLRGIYLAFATYASAFIVEEILARWESVTGGNFGLHLEAPELRLPFISWRFDTEAAMYYLILFLCIVCLLCALNILRSPLGRAFVAVRDSEVAAQSMGVNLAITKTAAFVISAAMTGLAGALYAHLLFTITPEGFTIILSINLLMMIVVGGLGSLHGAFFGAVFLVVLPQILAALRDVLPPAAAALPGLESGLFGLVIILVVLFEPMGIYGRWVKLRAYFDLFPLYRKGSFKRQRQYMASERNR